MSRPPRDASEQFLSGYFLWRIMFVSVLIGGATLGMGLWMLDAGRSEIEVRTMTMQAIVLCQAFHLFNSRSIRKPVYALNFWGNKAVFAVIGLMALLQLSITYLPFMNKVFDTVPLKPEDWIWPILLGFAVFLVVEVEKFVMRRLDARKLN